MLVGLFRDAMNRRAGVATRRNPQRTRERLLQAAFQEIHKSGFRGTDLETILRAAGVTKAMYHHFATKEALGYLFIDPTHVVTIEAQGNYVLLRRMGGSDLLRESMSTVAEKLQPYGFVRIHRSVLINASFVEEIQPCTTGEYVLRIKGGKEFTVSRTYKKNLHSITPLWFGTDHFRAD